MIDKVCISLTRKCQLKCKYCHFDINMDKNHQCEDLSQEKLFVIVNNILEYVYSNKLPLFTIGIVGSGEPLIKFNLIQSLLEYIEQNDKNNLIKLYIVSNGLLYDEEKATYLYNYKHRLKINFSLDGHQELHDFARIKKDNQGSFNLVMNAVKLYKSLYGESPKVNVTIHKQSILQRDILLKFLETNFDKVTFSRMVDFDDINFKITHKEYVDFLNYAKNYQINVRQNNNSNKLDCTLYGHNCGVGQTNIYYSEDDIYHCGRFIDRKEYIIGKYYHKLNDIEEKLSKIIQPFNRKECFYNKYMLGESK